MKTFPEVEQFERYCAILCSHIVPKHETDKAVARDIYTKAVESFYRDARARLYKRDENHDQQTWDEHREWQANHKRLKTAHKRWLAEPVGSNASTRGTGKMGRQKWLQHCARKMFRWKSST